MLLRLLLSLFLLLAVPAELAVAQAVEGQPVLLADDLDPQSLRRALQLSLDYLKRLPEDRVVGEYPRSFTAWEIRESLQAFENLMIFWDRPERLAQEIWSRFELHPADKEVGEKNVLFTGYYQPVLDGSLTQSAEYRFPVYGKPQDLIVGETVTLRPELSVEKFVGRLEGERLVPYYSRDEIDRLRFLRGKGYEVAWVKDPVDLFFLHIQGSGILSLPDGTVRYLSYAASNGRRYTGIGRVLIDGGKIPAEEISMQSLRRYLAEHPEEQEGILAMNESYIFFRFVDHGPVGSLGLTLTSGRSVATDARLYPKGALALIVTSKPMVDSTGRLIGWQPFSRFVLNQDTGSAIRGPGRVDLYFGSGEEAGLAAGFMKSPGQIYFLTKKDRK